MTPQAKLLTIGDELLMGQVLNSNAQWISQQLTDLGIQISEHRTVGDREDEILTALKEMKAQFVFIGGGLGPTHDDITLETFAKFVQRPLEMDQDWISKVKDFFASRGREMPENNLKQGLLPKGCTRLDNDCGTAAGISYQKDQTQYFIFPGVPHEMKSMFQRLILPEVKSKSTHRILKTTLLTTGIGESALAMDLQNTVNKIRTNTAFTLAFLPSNTMVRLRLTMQTDVQNLEHDQKLFSEMENELIQGSGENYFGKNDDTIESCLLSILQKENKTLSLAESCTGGSIARQLTQIPGVSKTLKAAIIPYQTEQKISQLNVPAHTISEFGIVSAKTAESMAENCRIKFNSDYAIATTGYLGPEGGDAHADVGTVWIAVARANKTTVSRRFIFEKNRVRAMERATQSALDFLRRNL